MDHTTNMILAILVTHAVILLVQLGVRKRLPLGKTGLYGIYLMLLPVGFNCFGVGVPPLLVAMMVLLGLFVLLAGVDRTMAKKRVV